MTRSNNVTERRLLAAACALTNDEPTARRYLSDRSPVVRSAAAGSLVALGCLSQKEGEALLCDRSPVVRRRLCELAGSLSGLDYSPLLDDPAEEVVEAAAFALGETGDKRAVKRLCEVARSHPDPLCRESAVAALGAIGDARAKATVLQALGDVPAIRRRAVVALSAFSGRKVDDALRERLEDRDWQVRQAAADVLGLSGAERR